MTATVLFVDDDHRLTAIYAEAVRDRDMEAQCIHNVDDALDYLRSGRAADVIVWDMMMAPGRAFAEKDTKGGLATGTFLYREMRDMRRDAAFVLLTNMAPHDSDVDLQGKRSYVRYKADTLPEELADLVVEILESDAESSALVPQGS